MGEVRPKLMSRLQKLQHRLIDATCGHRVVFHHVPKCGGTSVTRALMRRYPFSFISLKRGKPVLQAMELLYPDETSLAIDRKANEFRTFMASLYLDREYRLLFGHIIFSNDLYRMFSPRYKFITLLREPVSLFLSTFFWNVTTAEERWRIDQNIETFLETPRARVFGSLYARFFVGSTAVADGFSRPAIEAAKANLRKFDAVGLVEDMVAFEQRLRQVLGVRIRIGHKNRARVSESDRANFVTPEVRRRIEELSAPNIEVYEFARRELAQQ